MDSCNRLCKGEELTKENKFFIGLPEGKKKGFCEPPQGDIYNSIVVDIEKDCKNCQITRCHMFSAIIKDGKIVARVFITHPPEYK